MEGNLRAPRSALNNSKGGPVLAFFSEATVNACYERPWEDVRSMKVGVFLKQPER